MRPETTFVLEGAGWPALLVEPDGVICRSNTAARRVFGPQAIAPGARLAEFWKTDSELGPDEFLDLAAEGASEAWAVKLQLPDRSRTDFMAYGAPVLRQGQRYVLVQFMPALSPPAASTTEPDAPRREVEVFAPTTAPAAAAPSQAVDASVAQRQKLECALQLTRTVALDFNNALTSILGHTSLLLGKIEPGHPWRHSLLEVEKSAERAAEIVFDLVAFSRQEKEAAVQGPGNLNELLRRTVTAFKSSAGASAEWSLSLEKQVYASEFDEAKMQQAFVKVLENALQSLGAGGQVTVSTRNLEVPEPLRDGTVQVPPGHYVRVEIRDTGCGIPPEALPRIFEPFFTTKRGPHRGLGLAWVYGIVTNHGGCVAISSRVGHGTAVRLYLPAKPKFVKDRVLKSEDLTGHQTILMVDDEDLVLTMGETILSTYGYRVLTANSGAKALELVSQSPGQIDLVVTDLVMPQMSGRELMEHLRALAPQIRIICSSGYARSPASEEEVPYLRKPFTSQDLLRKVKQALE